jgi:hypothetical protein
MKKFIITEEEKGRILGMHKTASSKHYLKEQVTGDDMSREEMRKLDEEMRKLDVILHEKFGVKNYTGGINCSQFMYGIDEMYSQQFMEYEKWLEDNGFNKEWNASRLCFGKGAVGPNNLQNIKNHMIKKGWYK